ncbi:MAG: futalosine hydrolase [Pirellulaceae bacterium]
MPQSKTLVLIPSSLELDIVRRQTELKHFLTEAATTISLEVSGVGILSAAITASRLIERQQPQHVVLFGIAGTYDEDRATVGQAYLFPSVSCFGFGVGQGTNFRPWETTELAAVAPCEREIGLQFPDTLRDETAKGSLISVAAVSNDADEVNSIRKHYPSAIAEDMEGFAVASACQSFAIPCTVIRGISNVAGQRDKAHWQIESALASACQLLVRFLGT